MHADSSLFAGLSLTHAERKHCIEHAYRTLSTTEMNDRKLQMRRLKSIKRKSNANANANVDKSFQLLPMRDTIFGVSTPIFPMLEHAKEVKFAYEILPEKWQCLSDAR